MTTEEKSDAAASDAFRAQPFLRAQLHLDGADPAPANRERPGPALVDEAVSKQLPKGLRKKAGLLDSARRFGGDAVVDAIAALPESVPEDDLPIDIRGSLAHLQGPVARFHGAKFSLLYFPWPAVSAKDGDRFGYLTPPATRAASRLPVDAATRALLEELGHLMGNADAVPGDSATPSGYTYVGQFVDHDITLDVSSAIDSPTVVDAKTINNMRSPVLDLDSVYGRGPALDAFLYEPPRPGEPSSAFRMLLGTNNPPPPPIPPEGGAGGTAGAAGMLIHTDFDVPRTAAKTAIIGDPRNNENLIVSQLHHTMLRFHNAIVDMLIAGAFAGDVFVEAKRQATLHYQWAVLHDFLPRICGQAAVTAALAAPLKPWKDMPVEFSVAAYRFGHSMIRNDYWLNFTLKTKPMSDVFAFVSPGRTPVLTNWVVDFNAFFETGIPVPVFNHARKIDSALAPALEDLDGNGSPNDLMGVLAVRNLLRGLVLGLPSGQATASQLGVPKLTASELTSGLGADEVAVLNKKSGLLLKKTPLWYYLLREAAVKTGGETLGPLGAKIVTETFVRMLRRDTLSLLNVPFAPSLPRSNPATFTFADLVGVAGVIQP
ncbi:heme peroxidase family protein [Microbacterium sp. NPDC058389]|uniref:peroxidase family protein n=1 Tax=Microbacterium sp. NPDC058389 TaxID=3346475 RepID=UPI00365F1E02